MDSPKLPDIKADVQKDPENEKKKSGFLAGLLSQLGGGAGASGAAGWGGFGGLGGAGVAGGLLATKAGLIGLILVATTVAGGGGLIAYKIFGPGERDTTGRSFQLFAEKPRPAPGSEDEEATSGKPDGRSASLEYLAKANLGVGAKPEDELPKDAATQQAAADAASAGAAVGDGSGGKANVGGNKAASLLKTDRKFGELSKLGSSGGGGGSRASGGDAGSSPGTLLASAKPGGTGSIGIGAAARAGGGQRGLIGRRMGGSAFKQLGQVNRDQRGARSSQAAGRTYDGGGSGGTNIAADNIGGSGDAGAGAGKAPSQNPTNASGNGNRFPSPPPAEPKNVTPWQGAINTAALLLAGASMLLIFAAKIGMGAKTLAGTEKALVQMLAGLAALLAIAAIAIGSMIAGGAYGQTLQGNMIMASGAFLTTSAAIVAIAPEKVFVQSEGGPLLYVTIGAGLLGMAALATAYFAPPKVYTCEEFENCQAPDLRMGAALPSEEAVKRYRFRV